jgi:hypothetical protein
MKQKILSLLVMFVCGAVWAQNTSREPIQGGTTNPVTQHEVDQSGEQKPLSELIKKKKRKPKTDVTAEPPQSETSAIPPAAQTPQDGSKTSTPTKN